MHSKTNQKLGFILVLLALTVPALSEAWQGTGNMSRSNMTEIQSFINAFPVASSTSNSQIDQIAKSISTSLNNLWDPAWNVAITKSLTPLDTVLFGYAFRDHWMWINGVPLAGSNRYLGYVIWKDYNCNNWKTVAQMSTASVTFTTPQFDAINTYSFNNVAGDVWASAYKFVTDLQGLSAFSSGALSVIMSVYEQQATRGYFCIYKNNCLIRSSIEYSNFNFYGSYILFQTR